MLVLRFRASHVPGDPGTYDVYTGNMVLGGIRRTVWGPSKDQWEWFFNGTPIPRAEMKANGMEPTLEEARAAFRRCFDRWLVWAALSEAR